MRLLWKRHGKLSRWYNVICLKHTQCFLNTWKSTTLIHNYRTAFHLTLFTETCKSRDLWKRAIWTVSRDFVCCSIISPRIYNVTLTLLLFTWKIQSEARDVLKVFFPGRCWAPSELSRRLRALSLPYLLCGHFWIAVEGLEENWAAERLSVLLMI